MKVWAMRRELWRQELAKVETTEVPPSLSFAQQTARAIHLPHRVTPCSGVYRAESHRGEHLT